MNLNCPHCGKTQPSLQAQRCAACGLTMISDRAWNQLSGTLPADLTALEAFLARPEALSPLDWPRIQPHLSRLAPWDELEHLLDPGPATLTRQLAPLRHAYTHYRRQWLIHRLIFFFLLQAPLLGLWLGSGLMLPFLLSLPVLGWAWLGLWHYRRQVRAQRPLLAGGSSA